MVYLAGQILLFMLVALVVGAMLAWIFLVGPLRRQTRSARAYQLARAGIGAGAGDAAVAGPGVGSPAALPADPAPTVDERAAQAPSDAVLEATAEPAPMEPAPMEPAPRSRSESVPAVSTEAHRPADNGLADDTRAGMAPSSRPVSDGGVGPRSRPAASLPDRQRPVDQNAFVSELTARLRRMEDESALERAELAARLATAEQQAAEAEQRVSAAERQVAVSETRICELEGALREAAGDRPADATPGTESELADGVAPASVGEGDVAGTVSDSAGVADVEDGVPGAAEADGSEVSGSEAGADDLDDGERGYVGAGPEGGGLAPAVSREALTREASLLRSRLADAERRSATFSSRLAMARTEAEDAQRQVAMVTTRLDRRQAEWAAERVRLLARLEAVGIPLTGIVDRVTAPPRTPDTRTAQAPSPADEGPLDVDDNGHDIEGDGPARRELRPARHVNGVARANGAGAPVAGTLTAPREPGLEPRTDGFGFDDRLGTAGLDPAGLDGLDELDAVGEITGDIDVRRAASLLGVFPPPRGRVPRTDNLKEIVGVGPMAEQRLRMLGVTTFRQLAAMNDAAATELARQMEGFGDRIEADDWVGQARVLHLRHYRGEM